MLSHAHPELQNSEFVIFADASRRYVDCSDGVCRLLGYTRQEILQKTIDDISFDPAEVSTLFTQYLKTGEQEGEYLVKRKDGSPLLIHYRSFVFKDGCKAAIWQPVQDWREPYLAALMELNVAKLKQKVQAALGAIQQVRQSKTVVSASEQQAIADAISALNALLRSIQ